MVEGAQAADSDDLDPDDFLLETLPGLCCFYGGPDPLDPSRGIKIRGHMAECWHPRPTTTPTYVYLGPLNISRMRTHHDC